MVDVLVSMPGFHAKEVEERATRPMEKLLWEIPGRGITSTSTSSEGQSLAICGSRSAKTWKQPGEAEQKCSRLRPHSARRFHAAHQGADD